jgi:hypothetical protein
MQKCVSFYLKMFDKLRVGGYQNYLWFVRLLTVLIPYPAAKARVWRELVSPQKI